MASLLILLTSSTNSLDHLLVPFDVATIKPVQLDVGSSHILGHSHKSSLNHIATELKCVTLKSKHLIGFPRGGPEVVWESPLLIV